MQAVKGWSCFLAQLRIPLSFALEAGETSFQLGRLANWYYLLTNSNFGG